MRVAIYARYSHDKQSERSIEDQVALCARHAQARAWTMLPPFTDAALSGAAMVNRPGLLAALAAAERGEFDILLCEDEDRISRSLEHLAHVVNRLNYAGAQLTTLSTERVETMHVAFKGLIAEDYLRNLSAKTRRGVRANAERGLATGGALYGYRTQPGGLIEIDEGQAVVIRRIFNGHAGGLTAREIAESLNGDAIPGPRGGRWNASTINGSRQRGNGILQSEIYAGVKIWNRAEFRKDPRTGRRLEHLRPPSEWKRTPVEHLRIVGQDVWNTVAARKAREGLMRPHELATRRPGLFSGLVKCSSCGGSYTAYTGGRLICATRREQGLSACGNRRTVARSQVEATVLRGLREQLLSPAAVKLYVRAYHAAAGRRRASLAVRRAPLDKRIAELGRRVDRGVEAILDGTAPPALGARLTEMEKERDDLRAQLAAVEAEVEPVELHPRLAEAYAAKVALLQDRLADAATAAEPAERSLADAVRGLIDKIVIRPLGDMKSAPVDVEIHGKLTSFLTPAPAQAGNGCMRLVVAGGSTAQTHTSQAVKISRRLSA